MTGFLPDKHEIIEVGCIIVRQDTGVDGKTRFEIVDECEFKIRPERITDADPLSLKIAGYDPSEWKDAFSLREGMELFAEKTKDTIMVAHDMARDFCFLEKAYVKTGVVNTMHYHKLDTISIAFAKLYDDPAVDKFSLRSLCEYLQVSNTRPHRALSDAKATFEVYQKLMEL